MIIYCSWKVYFLLLFENVCCASLSELEGTAGRVLGFEMVAPGVWVWVWVSQVSFFVTRVEKSGHGADFFPTKERELQRCGALTSGDGGKPLQWCYNWEACPAPKLAGGGCGRAGRGGGTPSKETSQKGCKMSNSQKLSTPMVQEVSLQVLQFKEIRSIAKKICSQLYFFKSPTYSTLNPSVVISGVVNVHPRDGYPRFKVFFLASCKIYLQWIY